MIEANFARRFFQHARTTLRTLLDRRIMLFTTNISSIATLQPGVEFDDDLLRGMRDLGDAARIGYRELNPAGLLRYQRWSTGAKHRGRVYRGQVFVTGKPEFQYPVLNTSDPSRGRLLLLERADSFRGPEGL